MPIQFPDPESGQALNLLLQSQNRRYARQERINEAISKVPFAAMRQYGRYKMEKQRRDLEFAARHGDVIRDYNFGKPQHLADAAALAEGFQDNIDAAREAEMRSRMRSMLGSEGSPSGTDIAYWDTPESKAAFEEAVKMGKYGPDEYERFRRNIADYIKKGEFEGANFEYHPGGKVYRKGMAPEDLKRPEEGYTADDFAAEPDVDSIDPLVLEEEYEARKKKFLEGGGELAPELTDEELMEKYGIVDPEIFEEDAAAEFGRIFDEEVAERLSEPGAKEWWERYKNDPNMTMFDPKLGYSRFKYPDEISYDSARQADFWAPEMAPELYSMSKAQLGLRQKQWEARLGQLNKTYDDEMAMVRYLQQQQDAVYKEAVERGVDPDADRLATLDEQLKVHLGSAQNIAKNIEAMNTLGLSYSGQTLPAGAGYLLYDPRTPGSRDWSAGRTAIDFSRGRDAYEAEMDAASAAASKPMPYGGRALNYTPTGTGRPSVIVGAASVGQRAGGVTANIFSGERKATGSRETAEYGIQLAQDPSYATIAKTVPNILRSLNVSDRETFGGTYGIPMLKGNSSGTRQFLADDRLLQAEILNSPGLALEISAGELPAAHAKGLAGVRLVPIATNLGEQAINLLDKGDAASATPQADRAESVATFFDLHPDIVRDLIRQNKVLAETLNDLGAIHNETYDREKEAVENAQKRAR